MSYANEVICLDFVDWLDGHQPIRKQSTTYSQAINRSSRFILFLYVYHYFVGKLCRVARSKAARPVLKVKPLFQSRFAVSGGQIYRLLHKGSYVERVGAGALSILGMCWST